MPTPHTDGDNPASYLLDEALKIKDAAARRTFLEERCAGDQELFEEVESLLPFAETLKKWKELDEPPAVAVGARVGKYEIKREIGRGGMGTVYLGVRSEDYRQVAAVKLINRQMLSKEGVQRFVKETEIMARLRHQNIARLFDAGRTEGGVPYVIMEYVEGKRIDAYCDDNKLTIEERLTLFRKVCSVVSYAHSNQIIHRDIKPGNLLVTADGEPKLIDFGIAKVANPAFDTGSRTVGGLLMSLGYASPEQLRGEKVVDKTTDVYSLGAVLYELLTGRRPRRLGGGDDEESIRAVCEAEVKRPSQVVRELDAPRAPADGEPAPTPESVSALRGCRPKQLSRRLAGDLDAIVLQAMCNTPRHRYPSVQALADDIDNHLHGRPVSARKGAWWKRVTHLTRKLADNLPPTSLGLPQKLAAYALLLAVGLAAWQYPRIEKALSRAVTPVHERSIQASLSRVDRAHLNRMIADLSEDIGQGFTHTRINPAWEASQMIISLKGQAAFAEGAAGNNLKNQMKSEGCYEHNQKPHYAASGWALLAMLKLGMTPAREQIDFIVERQNKTDGWWPLYQPPPGAEPNASTYATAYAVLSLHEYRESGASGYDRTRLDSAIRLGQRWLLESHIDGQARWWDVPYKPEGRKESVGLSGLVLHVLHRTKAPADELDALDRLWRRQLPSLSARASDFTVSTAVLEGGIIEDAKNLNMPWAIIATADAYAGGSYAEKKAATDWMLGVIDTVNMQAPIRAPYFIQSELLIALRYVLDDKVI